MPLFISNHQSRFGPDKIGMRVILWKSLLLEAEISVNDLLMNFLNTPLCSVMSTGEGQKDFQNGDRTIRQVNDLLFPLNCDVL